MQLNTKKNSQHNLRVNFSLRKEIFFVTLGSLLGAFTMFVPTIILDLTIGTQYYIVWLVFAKVVDSSSPTTGALIHFFVATIIGIITGIVLYKGNFLNISKISNGLLYGAIAGIVVFLVFFIPVHQFLLAPNMVQVISELDPDMAVIEAEELVEAGYVNTVIDSIGTHLIWGITVGIIASRSSLPRFVRALYSWRYLIECLP